jgi:hypothetical protein
VSKKMVPPVPPTPTVAELDRYVGFAHKPATGTQAGTVACGRNFSRADARAALEAMPKCTRDTPVPVQKLYWSLRLLAGLPMPEQLAAQARLHSWRSRTDTVYIVGLSTGSREAVQKLVADYFAIHGDSIWHLVLRMHQVQEAMSARSVELASPPRPVRSIMPPVVSPVAAAAGRPSVRGPTPGVPTAAAAGNRASTPAATTPVTIRRGVKHRSASAEVPGLTYAQVNALVSARTFTPTATAAPALEVVEVDGSESDGEDAVAAHDWDPPTEQAAPDDGWN